MTDYAHATARDLAVALHLYRRRLNPSRSKPTKTAAEVEAEVQRFIDLIRNGTDSHEAANIVGVAYHTMRERLYYRGIKLGDFQ